MELPRLSERLDFCEYGSLAKHVGLLVSSMFVVTKVYRFDKDVHVPQLFQLIMLPQICTCIDRTYEMHAKIEYQCIFLTLM